MITQDRNGNALPATVDAADLQWSCRIAYTAGDYLTPSSWTYYELPPSAILNRSRSSALDGSTWQTSLKLLADAVPELSDVQAYYQLEIDLVDAVGNSWPYHTGPIDSITDSYEEASGATVQTKEITSFGTLQRLKNARVNGFFWDGNAQTVTDGSVITGFAEPISVAVTTTGAAGTFTVPGAWMTVDAQVTTGYAGIIVSPNADFSGAYASPANYTVNAVDGSQLSLTFATAPAATIYVKYWVPRYFGIRNRAITYTGYPGHPTFVRISDGTMPYGSSETAPRRRLSDSLRTFAASGCTTTSITVQDPEPYKNAFTSRIVAPSGTGAYVEILGYTDSTGTEYYAPISSTDAAGVITLSVALPSAPAVGSPIRVVTTEIERELMPDTAGNRTQFFTSSALATEYTRDSFAYDARNGVAIPLAVRHYASASQGVYVKAMRYVPSTKGTLGSTDASIESFVYRTFTDFPATDVTKFFRSADFVQGSFSGCYVKGYSAANTTWDTVLREVTDLASAPNVFVHDLPDGRLKVGAYYQASTPDATLDQVYSIDAAALPEPVTAVAVKAIYKTPINIASSCRNSIASTAGSTLNNTVRLFDGDKTLSSDYTITTASDLATITMQLPFRPPELYPFLDRLVINPGTSAGGALTVKVTKTTTAGVVTTSFIQGCGYLIQQPSQPLTVAGQLIEEAIFRLVPDYSSRFAIVIEARPNLDSGGAVKSAFSSTEIELYATANAIWVARLDDQTTGAPTGWTTLNQQGFGSIWWQSSVTKPISNRYADTTYLKRVMPQYDSTGAYRFDRLQVIELEQSTTTECRRYAETFMDEYLRTSRTYTVSSILDPRIDLGDTVTISMDDGTNLDLFVWAIQDSGGSEDLSATYTLRDYSA
jgi:hypothetical protein